MKIKDFKEGRSIENFSAMIENIDVKQDKKANTYAALVLRDQEKQTIEARLWNYDTSLHDFLAKGVVASISGRISVWKDDLQIMVDRISPSSEPAELFARQSRLDLIEVAKKIEEMINTFCDPFVKAVAEDLWVQHKDDYIKAPAAMKIHNAWFGGLMEHSYALCKMALPLIEYYTATYQCKLNKDRVLFGCIFHDIGKIGEYDFSTAVIQPDPNGLLTPHIVQGIGKIYEATDRHRGEAKSPESFENERSQLVHLIASHHGTAEWGSPVCPSTIEAIVLHHLDNLDGTLMHAIEHIECGEGDVKGFSARSWVENRRFFRGGNG